MTAQQSTPAHANTEARALVRTLISDLQPLTHAVIEQRCAALALQIPPRRHTTSTGEVVEVSKSQRLQRLFEQLQASEYIPIARRFLATEELTSSMRYRTEELLWDLENPTPVNQRVRREIAAALEEHGPIWGDDDGLRRLMERLWVMETASDVWTGHSRRSKFDRHFLQNDDWSVLDLFKQLGALDCSSRRFVLFIEGLLSGMVNPDTDRQRDLVEAVTPPLESAGLKVAETGTDNGYPAFSLLAAGSRHRPPQLILFASKGRKPDLRLSEVLDGQVEVLDSDDVVLRYDREVPSTGLTWGHLLSWWGDCNGLDPESPETKRTLWNRLLVSLPDPNVSPPQRFLFNEYHRVFGAGAGRDLPALLPEVWLHWDPRARSHRGDDAMPTLRMDFVMLLKDHRRVVIEVDGAQHYSIDGVAVPAVYAETTRGDRDLRLAGYEVYRFAGYELTPERGSSTVREFFTRLFTS